MASGLLFAHGYKRWRQAEESVAESEDTSSTDSGQQLQVLSDEEDSEKPGENPDEDGRKPLQDATHVVSDEKNPEKSGENLAGQKPLQDVSNVVSDEKDFGKFGETFDEDGQKPLQDAPSIRLDGKNSKKSGENSNKDGRKLLQDARSDDKGVLLSGTGKAYADAPLDLTGDESIPDALNLTESESTTGNPHRVSKATARQGRKLLHGSRTSRPTLSSLLESPSSSPSAESSSIVQDPNPSDQFLDTSSSLEPTTGDLTSSDLTIRQQQKTGQEHSPKPRPSLTSLLESPPLVASTEDWSSAEPPSLNISPPTPDHAVDPATSDTAEDMDRSYARAQRPLLSSILGNNAAWRERREIARAEYMAREDRLSRSATPATDVQIQLDARSPSPSASEVSVQSIPQPRHDVSRRHRANSRSLGRLEPDTVEESRDETIERLQTEPAPKSLKQVVQETAAKRESDRATRRESISFIRQRTEARRQSIEQQVRDQPPSPPPLIVSTETPEIQTRSSTPTSTASSATVVPSQLHEIDVENPDSMTADHLRVDNPSSQLHDSGVENQAPMAFDLPPEQLAPEYQAIIEELEMIQRHLQAQYEAGTFGLEQGVLGLDSNSVPTEPSNQTLRHELSPIIEEESSTNPSTITLPTSSTRTTTPACTDSSSHFAWPALKVTTSRETDLDDQALLQASDQPIRQLSIKRGHKRSSSAPPQIDLLRIKKTQDTATPPKALRPWEPHSFAPWAQFLRWAYGDPKPGRPIMLRDVILGQQMNYVRPPRCNVPADDAPIRDACRGNGNQPILQPFSTGDHQPHFMIDPMYGRLVVFPAMYPQKDVRQDKWHPDYLEDWVLCRYQAVEMTGWTVWRFDRETIECRLPGCARRCRDHDLATQICRRCGVEWNVRYCSVAHMVADLQRHLAECQVSTYLFPLPSSRFIERI